MLGAEHTRRIGSVHLKTIVAEISGYQAEIVQNRSANAASSSSATWPRPRTARLPKMYVRIQCVQRKLGELASNRSTAALHSAVSGMVTPTTDLKRAKSMLAFIRTWCWGSCQR